MDDETKPMENLERSYEYQKFLEAIEINDLDHTIQCAVEMAKTHPDEPLVHMIAGDAYNADGQTEAALEEYNLVVAAFDKGHHSNAEDPELTWDTVVQLVADEEMNNTIVADAHLRLARIYCTQGKVNLALTEIKTLLRIRQDNTNDWQVYSNALLLAKRHAEGIKAARKSLEIYANNANALLSLGLNHYGLAAASTNNPQLELEVTQVQHQQAAVDAFEKALQLNPDDPNLLSKAGAYFLECGVPDLALRATEKALELNPEHKEAQKNHEEAFHLDAELNEETPQSKHAGSFAHDVAGLSDEVIDEAFDGDPMVYWNMD